ncbi:hypothetical protein [Herbiconiux liangxiaofengii]|uniref:hypothetical protein n=1 Tax=Herbiconiux liangxiaofengii TaxID=3342795 RepID=UPI0035B7C20F
MAFELAEDVLSWIELTFWVAVGGGATVRIVIVAVRRRRRDAVTDVLRPITDAVSVESRADGWDPSTSDQVIQALADSRPRSFGDSS